MKKLVLALLLIAALAGGGYWYWLGTPQYAMRQTSQAIARHDVNEFHQWVDVQTLSSSIVDDLLSEPIRKAGGVSLLERIIGFSLVSMFKPTLAASVQKQIDQSVARTGLEPEPEQQTASENKGILDKLVALVKPPSVSATLRELGFNKKNYRGAGDVQVNGDTATAGLRFYLPSLHDEVQVKFEMNKIGGRWRIMRIANLSDILSALAAAQARAN